MALLYISTNAPPTQPVLLDQQRLHDHGWRNDLHTALLVGGIGLIVFVSAALLWSWLGALLCVVLVVVMALLSPRVPPATLMRFYKAQRIGPHHGAQLLALVNILAQRAGLRHQPALYVIPSATLNAFATGTRDNAVIALTEGLLRRLDLKELAGVLAHEISHIRNNDTMVMGIADSLTRFTQILSYIGMFLALVSLPAALLGHKSFPVLAIVLLYSSPFLTSLLQAGLSRAREYDADLEAAILTGDPEGLASALASLERYQGRFWEDLMVPIPARRIPYPSLLRSHPTTRERIARLQDIAAATAPMQPIRYGDEFYLNLAGLHLASRAPRLHLFGFWY
ncbi:MAG: zinc metalloprotease HtpX [Hyphomicrobiaceae bacterium]